VRDRAHAATGVSRGLPPRTQPGQLSDRLGQDRPGSIRTDSSGPSRNYAVNHGGTHRPDKFLSGKKFSQPGRRAPPLVSQLAGGNGGFTARVRLRGDGRHGRTPIGRLWATPENS
jgi:hypothetical protein